MLSDKITVTQIGLTQSDLRLIETVFKLSADLANKYSLNTAELLKTADIVFVNTDQAESVAQWEEIVETNPQATPIRVTSHPTGNEINELSRPLSLKKLMSALQSVITIDRTPANKAAPNPWVNRKTVTNRPKIMMIPVITLNGVK